MGAREAAPGGRSQDERIEEIEATRRRMEVILRELDLRRQELIDWRWQLQEKRRALAIGAAGLLLIAAGAAGLLIRARRERNRPMARLKRRRDELRRKLADRLSPRQPGRDAARGAAASAARAGSSALAKELAKRAGGALLP